VQSPYPDAAPVTLLQLALHTSGLALSSKDAAPFQKGSAADWEKTLHAALPHTSFEFEPGTHGALSDTARRAAKVDCVAALRQE